MRAAVIRSGPQTVLSMVFPMAALAYIVISNIQALVPDISSVGISSLPRSRLSARIKDEIDTQRPHVLGALHDIAAIILAMALCTQAKQRGRPTSCSSERSAEMLLCARLSCSVCQTWFDS
jgi:hypothetical protein